METDKAGPQFNLPALPVAPVSAQPWMGPSWQGQNVPRGTPPQQGQPPQQPTQGPPQQGAPAMPPPPAQAPQVGPLGMAPNTPVGPPQGIPPLPTGR